MLFFSIISTTYERKMMSEKRNVIAEIDELKQRVAKLEQQLQQQNNNSSASKKSSRISDSDYHDAWIQSMRRSSLRAREENERWEKIYYSKKFQIIQGIVALIVMVGAAIMFLEFFEALIFFLKK